MSGTVLGALEVGMEAFLAGGTLPEVLTKGEVGMGKDDGRMSGEVNSGVEFKPGLKPSIRGGAFIREGIGMSDSIFAWN